MTLRKAVSTTLNNTHPEKGMDARQCPAPKTKRLRPTRDVTIMARGMTRMCTSSNLARAATNKYLIYVHDYIRRLMDMGFRQPGKAVKPSPVPLPLHLSWHIERRQEDPAETIRRKQT